MAQRRGQFQVVTTEPDGREFIFFCISHSEADAERQFRSVHKRWRRELKVIPPAFPEEKGKGKKK